MDFQIWVFFKWLSSLTTNQQPSIFLKLLWNQYCHPVVASFITISLTISQRKAGMGGEDKNPSLKDMAAAPEHEGSELGRTRLQEATLRQPNKPKAQSPELQPRLQVANRRGSWPRTAVHQQHRGCSSNRHCRGGSQSHIWPPSFFI